MADSPGQLESVPDSIDFPKEEEKTLGRWKEIDAFKTSLKQSKGKPRYTFYDGPPFATGLPHYGHILAGTIKDIVTRWAHQSGFHVDRRFGWDCHGLPIEYEIDKTLGVKSPEDVKKLGIRKYNEECRKIVMRYSAEWENSVKRLGRWIDFERDYKTMYPWFMESVWWVFKELFNKGLVYRGVKVMPYSIACSTPLSNFESGQNYKDVQDPEVVVSFPLEDEPGTSVLAWTTTPWTLPSNLALCVHPDLEYVKIKDEKHGGVFILMKERLVVLKLKEEEMQVVGTFKGKELEGRSYVPLFPYFAHMKKERGAFRILCDTYVTTDAGTGVVHQAPYFGEDDNRVCLKYNVITRDMKPVCPVDDTGKFTDEVTHFKGEYVKDADKNIIKHLKNEGRLVYQGTMNHSYPFCWRSDTPLIYRAVPCWFVRVEILRDQLLANNAQTYWVPDFVKEKRFGNWLEGARDWCISRNRFWGTPIPLWVSEDMEEVVCIGSIEELSQRCGTTVEDLHRETIDPLTIPSSRPGKPPLRRIEEVFDCWFESGSMPYAQNHYPFENRKDFEDGFPADFIAEGIDQTRGWFYTLLVLSTALFGKPPFKNLIVNGIVQTADGEKMSKRKKNYPDPEAVVNKYGADALRLYLINSPVVRGENLKFREEGVREVLKDVFLPLFNAYRFLVQNIQLYEKETGEKFTSKLERSENIMDRWILSFTNTLVDFVRKEMKAYRLYTVVPRLVKYVGVLTNWYVRMNRRRLKGDFGEEDALASLESLSHVLLIMIRLLAPFTPFLTDMMWRNLRHILDPDAGLLPVDSVHYLMLPHTEKDMIDTEVEKRVAAMQTVIETTRVLRERNTLPVKTPLKELVVIHQEERYLKDVRSMESYILDETNVKQLVTSTDKTAWGVILKAEADFRNLGQRLKNDFKKVLSAIKDLSQLQLEEYREKGETTVCGHVLSGTDLKVVYEIDAKQVSGKYHSHSEENTIVLLDVTPDAAMIDEGVAREISNRIQRLRKKAKLVPEDAVRVCCGVGAGAGGGELRRVLEEWREVVEKGVKQPVVLLADGEKAEGPVLIRETQKVKDADLEIVIVDRREGATGNSDVEILNGGPVPKKPLWSPSVVEKLAKELVHVQINPPVGSRMKKPVTILLEHPKPGENRLDYGHLRNEVSAVFDLWDQPRFRLSTDKAGKDVVHPQYDMLSLSSKTLFVHTAN